MKKWISIRLLIEEPENKDEKKSLIISSPDIKIYEAFPLDLGRKDSLKIKVEIKEEKKRWW